MKADTLSLSLLFGRDVRYLVPLYQRPYVWKEETHWAPLWDDIGLTMRKLIEAGGSGKVDASPVPPHFLGAVVLDQQHIGTGSLELRHVIDGQQRLTTLQLFIAAASNVAHRLGVERASRILRKLVENDADLVRVPDDIFKVWPTNANQQAFRTVMKSQGGVESEIDDPNNLVQEAYTYFDTTIADWAAEFSGNRALLEEQFDVLTAVVRQLLKVVVIDLDPNDNAQVIFETLNARGTPLLAIDLVKNLVFERAQVQGANVEDLYRDQWQPFDTGYWRGDVRQGRLNRPRVELFLMHWLTMWRAKEVGARDLYPTFRDLLRANDCPPVVALVQEFVRDAVLFRGFDQQPAGTRERTFFDRLQVLDVSTIFPFVLMLYRQPETVLTREKRLRALLLLESWLVRRMMCGLTTKNYNRFVVDLLKLVRDSPASAYETLLDTLRAATAETTVWPTDEQLLLALTTQPFYTRLTQPRVVMVLAAIEEQMRSERTEPVLIPGGLWIEHIMPQSWRANWPTTPPGDVLRTLERERHIHPLGNLTLVTKKLNPSMSNAAWPEKRDALDAHSVLMMNKRLVGGNPERFDEAAIDLRSEEMAKHAVAAWPGPAAEW